MRSKTMLLRLSGKLLDSLEVAVEVERQQRVDAFQEVATRYKERFNEVLNARGVAAAQSLGKKHKKELQALIDATPRPTKASVVTQLIAEALHSRYAQ